LEYEEINGLRFSRLALVREQRANLPLLGWQFIVICAVAVATLLTISRAVLGEIYKGNNLPALIFGIGMLLLLTLSPLLLLFLGPKTEPLLTSKRGRYPARVSVKGGGDTSNCRATGEVAINGPWLEFNGDAFSFLIAARDVVSPRKVFWSIRQTASIRLKLPDGCPSIALVISWRISPAEVREMKEELESKFEAWSLAAEPREASLLPPLRAQEFDHSGLNYGLRLLPASILVAIASASTLLLVPDITNRPTRMLGFALIGFFLIQVFALSVTLEGWRRKRWNAKLDRSANIGGPERTGR
jgi:hypothetical protein